jgi:hypothetical protein
MYSNCCKLYDWGNTPYDYIADILYDTIWQNGIPLGTYFVCILYILHLVETLLWFSLLAWGWLFEQPKHVAKLNIVNVTSCVLWLTFVVIKIIGYCCSQNFWSFFCPAAHMEIVIIILFKLKEITRTVQICSYVWFSSSDEAESVPNRAYCRWRPAEYGPLMEW